MPQQSTGKELRYLNKDFTGFRKDLIEYAKQYYPNTYNDFNESSPGMMFIEMASYVCLLYTSPSPRDNRVSRMPSSA